MGTRGFVPGDNGESLDNRVDQLVGVGLPDDLGTCQVPGLEEYSEGSYDMIYCWVVCVDPRSVDCIMLPLNPPISTAATLYETYAQGRDFSLRSPLDLASTRMNEDGIRARNVCLWDVTKDTYAGQKPEGLLGR